MGSGFSRSRFSFKRRKTFSTSTIGVIDQQPDGYGNSPQGHGVDAEVEGAHKKQRDQEGGGNGCERDEGGAKIQQEQEQNNRHQNRSLDEAFLHVGDGQLDETRLPEDVGIHDDARREGLLHAFQRTLDFPGERDRVGSRLLVDAHDHSRSLFGIEPGAAAHDRRAELQPGHVAYIDGLVLPVSHYRLADILQAVGAAQVADQEFAVGTDQESAGGVLIGGCHGGFQFMQRDVVLPQAVGGNVDLILLHATADDRHLGNAGHRQQPRTDQPVCRGANVQRGNVGRIGLQGHQHDLAHDGTDRSQHGRQAFGQALGRQLQPFRNDLPVPVNIRIPGKFHKQQRKAHRRL